MKDITIKPLTEDNIDHVQIFMRNYWRKDHPIATNKDLFKWQYRGYGPLKGYSSFQLAFQDEEIVGFRAVIPMVLQIPKEDKKVDLFTCLASAMWMIHPKLRGTGLGYKLHNNTEKIADSSLAIGANPKTSVPIFRKSGYHELQGLYRWISPLKINHGKFLLENDNNEKSIEIFEEINNPRNISPNDLEFLWNKSAFNVIALHRTSEYWKWRYFDSPIFQYVFFGNIDNGIVIAREENVVYTENQKLLMSKDKVLRIVEIIPTDELFYQGILNKKLISVIKSVLAWGQENGCILADFFCSNKNIDQVLKQLGFYLQSFDYKPNKKSHTALFQPFERKAWNYNLFLRLPHKFNNMNFNESYFVRSDTDQDRPNILI